MPKCELRSWKSIGKACSTFEAMVWHLCIKIRTELEIHLDYLSLQVFWIYPIYCISFVLNTVMYQEAQSLSFVMFTCRPLQVSLAPSQKHLAVQTQKLVLHFFLLALFHTLPYCLIFASSLDSVSHQTCSNSLCVQIADSALRSTQRAPVPGIPVLGPTFVL